VIAMQVGNKNLVELAWIVIRLQQLMLRAFTAVE
jgi:hypothetical protein